MTGAVVVSRPEPIATEQCQMPGCRRTAMAPYAGTRLGGCCGQCRTELLRHAVAA
jgi:hypothetical protein